MVVLPMTPVEQGLCCVIFGAKVYKILGSYSENPTLSLSSGQGMKSSAND